MNEAYKVIQTFNKYNDNLFEMDYADIGGIAYNNAKNPLPEETLQKAKESDAILLGAVGGPEWEKLAYELTPEGGALLPIRKELGLFSNIRPAIVFDALTNASTLKKEVVEGLDIVVVRELTGGIYFGKKGEKTLENGDKAAYDILEYSKKEIDRITRVAFDLAIKRNPEKPKVCSVDKANVLKSSVLWRKVVKEIHEEDQYNYIDLSNMYVDNAAMQLIRNPKQFDVILTGNMFGDILSDAAAMATGSLGMLPSASIGAVQENGKQNALYEPVHGSAPDIAGEGKANPLATISSVEMMLRYSLNMNREADILKQAIQTVLDKGYRTQDILDENNQNLKIVSTSSMGDLIVKELESTL